MIVSGEPIDQPKFEHLLTAGAVHGICVVGNPGGWNVVFQYGVTKGVLSSRNGGVRIFRRFETLVNFLKCRDVAQYQVDARQYDPDPLDGERCNTAASHRMRQIHQAAAIATLTRSTQMRGIDANS